MSTPSRMTPTGAARTRTASRTSRSSLANVASSSTSFSTRYPTKMAALLPALWMVQEDRGWVSEAGMAEVADVLSLTPAYVKGVVTFYTMYHQHPVGKHFIQVCTTSPCNVCGAEDVVNAFLQAHEVR